MSNLYNRLRELYDEKGVSGYRMCKDVGIQPNIMTDLKMERRVSTKVKTAQEVADYFGVTVGYLLGEGKEKVSTREGEREPELSLAFFRLKQRLKPCDIPGDDTDFLPDIYKAHTKEDNQG